MASPASNGAERQSGSLVVVRTVDEITSETFVRITADGSVTAYNGHVDLGTGIRTALGQIVAEELDVSFARVVIVLGDTAVVPNQGATIASETIQITAVPLRKAAAQARHFLIARAAERLELPEADLKIEDGLVRGHDNRSVSYGELIGGETIRLELADDVAVKPVGDYAIVGQSMPRVDLPAKATGELTFVHDVRLPGMLHGRVVRPPYAGVDAGPFVGTSLLAVDESSVRDVPGIIAVVHIGDFVGIVAEREENAIRAAEQLKVSWKPTPTLTDLADVETALRANPSTPRTLIDKGDVNAAISGAAKPMQRTYVWPYQMHASIGPSCAVADFQSGDIRVWSGTQNPHLLRGDLALLIERPESEIEVIRLEAAGCYGRNCADDVTADALLLSRAVGRPVRVQLTREQEHAWEPKGTAQLIDVNGGLNADGGVAAYDLATRYPSNAAPTLALLLTGRVSPDPAVLQMGDRTAIPPYDYDHMRVVAHDMAPIVRASWLRGVSALPNTFAHESYIDEAATEAGVDPIEYRLRYLKDQRAVDLVNAVAERAGWTPRPVREEKDGEVVHGRGFAYALYVHSKFPGYGAAWSAWVADVAVNKTTGDVSVTRVVAGQDSGLMINPDGVRHQIHGNVIQSTSRALMEEVSFERGAVAAREWGAYPIIPFPDVPKIDVLMLPRPDQPPLGVGESASVPSAAAIANAIFDATGVRFREPPFTPERILRGLHGDAPAAPQALPAPAAPQPSRIWQNPFARRAGIFATIAAVCTAAIGVGAALLPGRAIAPIARPDASVYSAATIARGAQLAALGNCAECHTTIGGALNAGGRALATPFGTIYATNITPDVETGIGAWSYPAFERAMRDGLHRDGRQLYPAFPYTHFSKTSEADLQALYAYLMAQPAARATGAREHARLPVEHSPAARGLECAVSSDEGLQARSRAVRAVESRRLSGRKSRPLQRLPFAAQRARRRAARGLSRRRLCRGLGGAAADVAVACTDPLERGRALRLFAHRPVALSRRRRRPDGACCQGSHGPARSGHSRDGRLSQLVQRRRHRGAGCACRQARERNASHHRRLHRRAALSGRLRRLPRGRRPAAVRQPALARAQQQSAQRITGQSRAGDPARHRRASIERSRLHACVQEQHERRADRGARHVPAQAVRPRQAGLDRRARNDRTRAIACPLNIMRASSLPPAACRGCGRTRWSSGPTPALSCAPPRSTRSASSRGRG
ncbi:nicotinate dehydrogenase subunit B [Bradyrhizobium diazoefficiens]